MVSYMPSTTRKLEAPANNLLTRVLDSFDRGHASAADRMHGLRNAVREALSRGLDRLERVTTSTIGAARSRLARADERTADAIIHTQGRIGNAIERARHARSLPGHTVS
jgi:hypothetical protein